MLSSPLAAQLPDLPLAGQAASAPDSSSDWRTPASLSRETVTNHPLHNFIYNPLIAKDIPRHILQSFFCLLYESAIGHHRKPLLAKNQINSTQLCSLKGLAKTKVCPSIWQCACVCVCVLNSYPKNLGPRMERAWFRYGPLRRSRVKPPSWRVQGFCVGDFWPCKCFLGTTHQKARVSAVLVCVRSFLGGRDLSCSRSLAPQQGLHARKAKT